MTLTTEDSEGAYCEGLEGDFKLQVCSSGSEYRLVLQQVHVLREDNVVRLLDFERPGKILCLSYNYCVCNMEEYE